MKGSSSPAGQSSRPGCVTFPPLRRGGRGGGTTTRFSSFLRPLHLRIPVRIVSDQPREVVSVFLGSLACTPPPLPPLRKGGKRTAPSRHERSSANADAGPKVSSLSTIARAHLIRLVLMISLVLSASISRADDPGGDATRGPADPAAIEFFEKSVRPILVERCQGCHGPAKQKGGLRLDSREAVLAGGSTGAAIAPGSRRRACSSTRSTTASSTRCRRSRSCRPGRSPSSRAGSRKGRPGESTRESKPARESRASRARPR